MHGTFDKHANAAYLYLVEKVDDGASTRQVVAEIDGLAARVVVDLDSKGRLLGIEIIGATGVLLPETIATLRPIG